VHSAQTSRQVEEKQLVSPPWQRAHSHITRSTVPDFQKHYSDSPPPYSPDLAHCDFFLFPKTKLRLKGHRFDTTEEIHAETQEVIDTHLRTSRDALNHGKHVGIAVCMPKGTTSKETVETRSYLKKLFLWSNSHNFWVAPCMIKECWSQHKCQFYLHLMFSKYRVSTLGCLWASSCHGNFTHSTPSSACFTDESRIATVPAVCRLPKR
jgi:hypothetical protein